MGFYSDVRQTPVEKSSRIPLVGICQHSEFVVSRDIYEDAVASLLENSYYVNLEFPDGDYVDETNVGATPVREDSQSVNYMSEFYKDLDDDADEIHEVINAETVSVDDREDVEYCLWIFRTPDGLQDIMNQYIFSGKVSDFENVNSPEQSHYDRAEPYFKGLENTAFHKMGKTSEDLYANQVRNWDSTMKRITPKEFMQLEKATR